MEKRYSRKQIIEAIEHWQDVLKKMDKSKSPLLDACAKKFGEDVVFGNDNYKTILPSMKIIEDIYGIANKVLFDLSCHY